MREVEEAVLKAQAHQMKKQEQLPLKQNWMNDESNVKKWWDLKMLENSSVMRCC